MSKKITTHCPGCDKSFELDASTEGQKGRCDQCQTKFIITKSPKKKAKSKLSELKPQPVPVPVPVKPNLQPKNHNQKQSSAPILITVVLLIAGVCGYFFLSNSNSSTSGSPSSLTTTTVTPSPPEQATRPKDKPAPAKPIKLKPLTETYSVATEFKNLNIRKYRRTFPDVNRGWIPNSAADAKKAKSWANHLGPLGIRTRSYVQQLQGRPAFKAIVPKPLQSLEGDLALNAAEVTYIAPGSPSENHLKLGDLIIGIEGEMLKSGTEYRPGWEFMHKNARELQLMLGEKIDQAQARGDIRLKVLRFPNNNTAPALPLKKQTLWRGKGGNKSIGVQSFDIQLPANATDELIIETNQFDNSNGGDSSLWLGLTLEGDYGTQSFLSQQRTAEISGYGRISYKDKPYVFNGIEYSNLINLHGQGHIKIKIPAGTQRIKGSFTAASYGKVQPIIHILKAALPLTGEHKKNVVELRFPIGKTGSFSSNYPKNCPKSEISAKRHTAWIAAQQLGNGSWPRLAGYTSPGYDTAWCGLALMSSGDAKYDVQIKKAAYYLAYDSAPSEWTAERGMRLIFLSEYYLRYKDTNIIAGIQTAFHQLKACAKTDYMSGHKVNGFGYGISGQHYGTGHLALAVAIASKTPITIDKAFLEGVKQHAAEVCVNGKVSYGRATRRQRNDKRKQSGGNAMSGPMMIGSMIGGGNGHTLKTYIERLDASIGDGDNSHSSSSLAFIFSSLSMAAENEELFLKHMQNFRYKMTIDDLYAGGYMKSAFPLDLAAGENATANWIRTSGHIMILNALKKNLVMTGKREHWSKERNPEPSVTEWGALIHTYYLRNACIAKELLGAHAAAELTEHINALHALKRDLTMVPKTRELVLKNTPNLVKQIANNKALRDRQRAYSIELLTGIDFSIRTTRTAKGEQTIKLQVNQPLYELNWLDTDKEAMYKRTPYPFRANVSIKSPNINDEINFKVRGLIGFSLDKGSRRYSSTKPVKASPEAPFKGEALISYTIGGTSISYKRPLFFNTDFANGRNEGRAPNNINLRRFLLKLRMAPRAYYQSQPLIIAGIPFDCMYPAERMVDFKTPKPGVVNIHEGDKVTVDMASYTPICGWVHRLDLPAMNQVKIHHAETHDVIAGKVDGDINQLYDNKETSCKLTVDPKTGSNIIEYGFKKPVTINGLDITTKGAAYVRIWYKKGTQWIPIVWDNYSPNTSYNPTFPDISAQHWRVETKHRGGRDFQTLRFYHNSHRIDKRQPLKHTEEPKYFPKIKAK